MFAFGVFLALPIAHSQRPATKGSAAEPKTALGWFQRAQDQMNLRMPGSLPFHMKVTFHAFPGDEVLGPKEKPQILTGDGVYEETWLAPHHWRREVTFGSYHAVEVESDKGRKMQATSDYEPSRVLLLLSTLLEPIPRELLSRESDAYRDRHWSVGQATVRGVNLVVATARASPSEQFSTYYRYFFLPQGLLVFERVYGLTISWQNDTAFAGKAVPRKIMVQAPGMKRGDPDRDLLIADVSIAPAGTTNPAYFDLPISRAEPGMTLRPLFKVDRPPQRLNDPFAELPLHHDAAIQFMGVLDRKGEIRELEVVNVMDADNLHEIVEDVRRFRYRPAEIDGSRCEMPYLQNLLFQFENHSDIP